MEMEEETRARLKNDAATKWLRLAMKPDEERKTRLEKIVASGWPWRQRKKEEKKMEWI